MKILMRNKPTPANFLRWFDPRHKQIGTWAFILNRVTAIGLVVYLVLHLFVLSGLAFGQVYYDAFVQLVKHPVFVAAELLVVAAGLIHGLNGIRVGMTSFGIGVRIQKQLFTGLMALAVLGIIYFGIRMFS